MTLNCIDSEKNITIAAWKFNGKNLISFKSPKLKLRFNESDRLKVEMSDLESERYALIIKEANKTHEGNYTCEITATSGVFDKVQELIITGQ